MPDFTSNCMGLMRSGRVGAGVKKTDSCFRRHRHRAWRGVKSPMRRWWASFVLPHNLCAPVFPGVVERWGLGREAFGLADQRWPELDPPVLASWAGGIAIGRKV